MNKNDKRPKLEINQTRKKFSTFLINLLYAMKYTLKDYYYKFVRRKNTILWVAVSVAIGLFIYLAFVFSELFIKTDLQNTKELQKTIIAQIELKLTDLQQTIKVQNEKINDLEALEIQNRKVVEKLDAKVEEAIRTFINKKQKPQDFSQIERNIQQNLQTQIENNAQNIEKIKQTKQDGQIKQKTNTIQQFDKFFILHNAIKYKFSKSENFQQILDKYLKYLDEEQEKLKQLLQKYASANHKIQLDELDEIIEKKKIKPKTHKTDSEGFYQWIKNYVSQFVEVKQKDNQKILLEQQKQIKNDLEIAILSGNFNLAKNIIHTNQLSKILDENLVQKISEMAQIQNELEKIYYQKLSASLKFPSNQK